MFILLQMSRHDLSAIRIERDVVMKYLDLKRLTKARTRSLLADLAFFFTNINVNWEDKRREMGIQNIDIFAPGVSEVSYSFLEDAGNKTRHVTVNDAEFSHYEWSVRLILESFEDSVNFRV